MLTRAFTRLECSAIACEHDYCVASEYPSLTFFSRYTNPMRRLRHG